MFTITSLFELRLGYAVQTNSMQVFVLERIARYFKFNK